MKPDVPALISALSRRLSTDRRFFSSALVRYKELHRLEDSALCAVLKCSQQQLNKLALCRVPAVEEADGGAARDVRRIAHYSGCDEDQLIALLREVQIDWALGAPEQARSHLLAARLRDEHPPDSDEGPSGAD